MFGMSPVLGRRTERCGKQSAGVRANARLNSGRKGGARTRNRGEKEGEVRDEKKRGERRAHQASIHKRPVHALQLAPPSLRLYFATIAGNGGPARPLLLGVCVCV